MQESVCISLAAATLIQPKNTPTILLNICEYRWQYKQMLLLNLNSLLTYKVYITRI